MICVSIGSVSVEECINAIKKYEFAEVRLDLMDVSDSDIKKIFSASSNLIATCREGKFKETERTQKLKTAILSGAAYVDVEVESDDSFKNELTAFAKDKGTKLIVSYHNYDKTPSRVELDHIVDWCLETKPDVIKIACMSHGVRDNARLLGLLDNDVPMIAVGMGDSGRVTRLISPKLGAFCTFAALSSSNITAPGQVTKEEIKTFLSRL